MQTSILANKQRKTLHSVLLMYVFAMWEETGVPGATCKLTTAPPCHLAIPTLKGDNMSVLCLQPVSAAPVWPLKADKTCTLTAVMPLYGSNGSTQ